MGTLVVSISKIDCIRAEDAQSTSPPSDPLGWASPASQRGIGTCDLWVNSSAKPDFLVADAEAFSIQTIFILASMNPVTIFFK